jgi:hypothetical protein
MRGFHTESDTDSPSAKLAPHSTMGNTSLEEKKNNQAEATPILMRIKVVDVVDFLKLRWAAWSTSPGNWKSFKRRTKLCGKRWLKAQPQYPPQIHLEIPARPPGQGDLATHS